MTGDIYCRWCAWPTELVNYQLPSTCHHCQREGRWTTIAPLGPYPLPPRYAYRLTDYDRCLLRILAITQDA